MLSRPSGGTALDLFLVSAAILVGLGATYLLERGARDVFAQRRLIEAQAAQLAEAHATSERLLLNVLPGPVAERLKAGETTIADAYADATVLFADLVGFTPLAAEPEPGARRSACSIGCSPPSMTWSNATGSRRSRRSAMPTWWSAACPCRRTTTRRAWWRWVSTCSMRWRALAVEIGRPLDLRIGVHTGPLVAGVIGTRKFSYDLWGDTVNIASRLESHGVIGAVQMSEATWSRVRGERGRAAARPDRAQGTRHRARHIVVTRRHESVTLDGIGFGHEVLHIQARHHPLPR